MNDIDITHLTDEDIDNILDLIEQLSGNPALTEPDRQLLGDLAEKIGDHATELVNAALDKDNAGIKSLLGEFGQRKSDLKVAHDKLVGAAEAFDVFAQGIAAFGKIIGVLTDDE